MPSNPAKPRATDVARWVAILAAPLPSEWMRCDYRDARKAQTNARSALRSWGLRDDGTPIAPTLAATVATDVEIATAYAERSIADQGDPWIIAQGVPTGAGAAPLSGPCRDGAGQ